MGRIFGIVERITEEYIIIEELDTKKLYNIPRGQIKKNVIINEKLVFYKQYNSKNAKNYLTLERDDYKLNEIYDFEIIRTEEKIPENRIKKNFFIVVDKYGNEYEIVSHYHQLNEETRTKLKCEVIGYNRDKLKLVNADDSHPHYSIGNQYKFQIVDFLDSESSLDCYKILVNDLDGNSFHIKGFKWQKRDLWKFSDVICEVRKFDERGLPILINKDIRHPIYEIQKEYSFKIIGTKQKEDCNDHKKIWDVILLLGEDGCIHETNAYQDQIQDIKIDDYIRCEVVSINHRLKLKQIYQIDPYFEEISKIIPDPKHQKYAYKTLESLDSNFEIFKEQYNSKRSFWVLTFCNRILPLYFRSSLELKNYSEATEIAELIILLEHYILKGKFLQSFPDELNKTTTELKASMKLEEYKTNLKCIQIIKNSEIEQYLKRGGENNLHEISFFIQHCDEAVIKKQNIVLHLINILCKTSQIDRKTSSVLFHLDKLLSYRKRVLYNNNQEINIIAKIDSIFGDREAQDCYFQWTYCQYLINIQIENYERSSYLAGKILRLYFFVTEDYNEKKKSLYHAYYLLTHKKIDLSQVFKCNKTLTIDFRKLEYNPNVSKNMSAEWKEIRKSYNEGSSLLFNVRKKHYDGFEVSYNGIIGFLPVHHITDVSLKKYCFPEIDFTISASCILFSEEFNFFVVKQLDYSSQNFISINNLYCDPSLGCIIAGVVKSVTEYGIFVTTLNGDALLHKSEISEHFWDKEKLNEFFKVGDKIYAVIIDIDKVSQKIDLSIKSLSGTEYDFFYKGILNRRDFKYFYEEEKEIIEDSVEIKSTSLQQVQIERAYCFEQYALLQSDLDSKIHYLRIAKQFFSTINSARSYLINLYTEYFQLIEDLNFNANLNFDEKLSEIKNKAIQLKNRIQVKTMETFPDVKKLNDFLEVLSLFNEISDYSFDRLINLLQTKIYSVRTIVKITLANNLMVSETKEGSEFTMKNLRLVKTYLDNGILTLDETQSDKLTRELKEKLNYWKGKISENEGENLEFKSSFKTPILDKAKIEKLNLLEQKLEKGLKNETLIKERDRLVGSLAQKQIIHSSLKTLAAFANTNGGTLLLGVTDNQSISGLEADYNSLKESNRDGFGKFFDDKIREYFEESFSSLLEREFVKFPNGDILIIKVRPSLDPIFLLKDKDGENKEQLFIRELTTTKEIIQKKELVKFIKIRLQKQIKEIII